MRVFRFRVKNGKYQKIIFTIASLFLFNFDDFKPSASLLLAAYFVKYEETPLVGLWGATF